MENLPLILSIIALVAAFVALDRTRRANAQPPRQPQPTPATPARQPADATLALAPPAPALAPAPAPDTTLPAAPEILAAIAAAVSIVCGPNARIADLQPAYAAASAPPEPNAHPWAMEGRRALHTTHRLR